MTSTIATLPHLSHSRVSRYIACPEQYRLHYVEGLRPLVPPASLHFGKAVHAALAHLFLGEGHPVECFRALWIEYKETDLNYGFQGSWDKLNERGANLLQQFVTDELKAIESVEGVEIPFELSISNVDAPFVGVIDLLARIGGRTVVVDFKTSSSAFADYDAPMSDQLAGYRLAYPEADDAAFCVLRKGREAKIDWHFAGSATDQLPAFTRKLETVGHQIADEQFFRRPGQQCRSCAFLAICLGGDPKESTVKAEEQEQGAVSVPSAHSLRIPAGSASTTSAHSINDLH